MTLEQLGERVSLAQMTFENLQVMNTPADPVEREKAYILYNKAAAAYFEARRDLREAIEKETK